MKVSIKGGEGGCTGHGRCFALADDVYELDEEGYNVHRGSTIDVPAGHEESARLGARACPERALKIIDDSP